MSSTDNGRELEQTGRAQLATANAAQLKQVSIELAEERQWAQVSLSRGSHATHI
jgi:hypothetical protein